MNKNEKKQGCKGPLLEELLALSRKWGGIEEKYATRRAIFPPFRDKYNCYV